MRSIYANIDEWDAKPTPIDTKYMKGEGYSVTAPDEMIGKSGYDLDVWAVKWLKENNHPIRADVGAFWRDDNRQLGIMSCDWKPEVYR